MSIKGKKACLEINGYKKDGFPADEDNTMSPDINFKNELCPSSDMREGDKLYEAKIHENPEDPIPEGVFGCFEPVGRPNIHKSEHGSNDD